MRKLGLFILTATISVLTSFGTLAGEWMQDGTGWWYDNGDATYEKNGWRWINERWYYFTPEGYCLVNTTTPDGYQVDENGAWIVYGVVQTKRKNVAVISSKLQFTAPAEYYISNKIKEPIIYMSSGTIIEVYDIDYEKDIKQQYPEGEHAEMNLDYEVANQTRKNYSVKSSRNLNSGDWTRYDYNQNRFGESGVTVTYARLIGDHLHIVSFTGYIAGIDTDVIMNACVQ